MTFWLYLANMMAAIALGIVIGEGLGQQHYQSQLIQALRSHGVVVTGEPLRK